MHLVLMFNTRLVSRNIGVCKRARFQRKLLCLTAVSGMTTMWVHTLRRSGDSSIQTDFSVFHPDSLPQLCSLFSGTTWVHLLDDELRKLRGFARRRRHLDTGLRRHRHLDIGLRNYQLRTSCEAADEQGGGVMEGFEAAGTTTNTLAIRGARCGSCASLSHTAASSSHTAACITCYVTCLRSMMLR